MGRLFWKLFTAWWISLMGFIVLTTWVNATLVEQNIPDPPEVAFKRSIQKANSMLSRSLKQGGEPAARAVINRLPRQIRNHVFLFDEENREVLGRDRMWRHIRSTGVAHSKSSLDDGQGHAYLVVVLRRAPPARFLERGSRGNLLRLLLAAATSALVSFALARYLSRPMQSLGKASRSLAQGDLGARVGVPLTRRKDEFGDLARDFDEMAEHLQRLQGANRRLLRDVSHELRSPLARLRVALEIARNRDSDHVANELDRIELESERLEALVDQVLDLLHESSGTVPLNMESFDLADLLQDLEEVVSYEVPEGSPGLQLALQGPLQVFADRELMWRAIENLVRNAFIHTGHDGKVRLSAELDEKGSQVRLIVSDSGPGVPTQHLERIFDPFYRVQDSRDRETGGHGLGLAIAAAAIRRHGGDINARNRKPSGLEIEVSIPGRT